jgi:hypothetical protein
LAILIFFGLTASSTIGVQGSPRSNEFYSSGLFPSDVLGISFQYPREWGNIGEEIVPAWIGSPSSPPAPAQYQVEFLAGGLSPAPNLSADNPQTIADPPPVESTTIPKCRWPAPWTSYAGEPLANICQTKSFYSGCVDAAHVKLLSCAYKTSKHGVPYVAYSVEENWHGVPTLPADFADPTAYAEGIIFQTKSAEWPGMSIETEWYDDGEETASTGKARIAPTAAAIYALAETLAYP